MGKAHVLSGGISAICGRGYRVSTRSFGRGRAQAFLDLARMWATAAANMDGSMLVPRSPEKAQQ